MTQASPKIARPRTLKTWMWLVLGVVLGGLIAGLVVVLVAMPFALGHRNDLPLEKLYGDLAVGLVVRMQAGSDENPFGDNQMLLESGRIAYIGSCAICHGANGDGKGLIGQAIYPPATDLRGRDTQDKTDAQLYWIIENGLSFAGMPSFADQYDEPTLWSLVMYTRSLAKQTSSLDPLDIPKTTDKELAMANPQGDGVQRGAAVYFAMGCHACHGPTGNAPGELRLRDGREVAESLREGVRGMPLYDKSLISDTQMRDLVFYINTFPSLR